MAMNWELQFLYICTNYHLFQIGEGWNVFLYSLFCTDVFTISRRVWAIFEDHVFASDKMKWMREKDSLLFKIKLLWLHNKWNFVVVILGEKAQVLQQMVKFY